MRCIVIVEVYRNGKLLFCDPYERDSAGITRDELRRLVETTEIHYLGDDPPSPEMAVATIAGIYPIPD